MIPAIAVDRLGVTFPGRVARTVLRGVDLEVRAGEAVAVVGPSGSGKSTLVACLSGIIPHAVAAELEGSVRVLGDRTTDTSLGALSTKVGVVFQNPDRQLITTTVEDEIVLSLEHRMLSVGEIRSRLEETLALCGLSELRVRPLSRLSGGQRQKAAIASVVAGLPSILLLDEPTSDLDPQSTAEVFALLRRIVRERAITAVVVTNSIDHLEGLVDRIVVLAEGEKVLDAPTKSALRQVSLLERVGIRPPQVTEFFFKLGGAGDELPTSVEEGARRLEALGLVALLASPASADGSPGAAPSGARPPAPGGRPPAISVENVTYDYVNGFRALDRVDFEIGRGDYVAIVGENGSGKTTLAKLLIGLLRPVRGRILAEGQDLHRIPVSAMARRIGFLFQNPDHQIFLDTVRDEVAFGPRNLGLQGEVLDEAVDGAIRMARLEPYASSDPFQLSAGERQRVAYASILAMQPQLAYLLDEPTTGQDYRNLRGFMDLVTGAGLQEGRSVVMITHDMTLVAEGPRRVIVMAGGKVIADGTPGAVFTDRTLMQRARIAPPPIVQMVEAAGLRPVPPDLLTVDRLLAAVRAVSRPPDAAAQRERVAG